MGELLTLLSGSLVGFSLGLIGGGGSILAVPLLLYVVGVDDPHVAIGTSALAVAINALANLAQHARAGTVKWPCAATFAASGVAGALAGSTVGKSLDGEKLLFLFAFVMIVVAISMLRGRGGEGDPSVRINRRIALRLIMIGFVVGGVSGLFGIGGGFLIVPGIMAGSGMAVLNAVGSSLFSVGAFGLTTAANYALSGLVAWKTAAVFIGGGVIGGIAGMKLAVLLSRRKGALTRVFAAVLIVVAAYMLYRNASAIGLL
ncbi:hypothetical protein C882_0652 [Caenispirillum salinarum AK4]|uniref:Probable membrane transporter protein n=1 Tax=Caenispirillum salinarum AK4 TaxID=1238182 RepID=K9GVV8_9PROT|nr:sulfite exporter TauE/SafE family protein [Caenispirillum salinarum]EKV28889.1 hypothetical protein C882_0652 [Caenispirillum salinarum AK4]